MHCYSAAGEREHSTHCWPLCLHFTLSTHILFYPILFNSTKHCDPIRRLFCASCSDLYTDSLSLPFLSISCQPCCAALCHSTLKGVPHWLCSTKERALAAKDSIYGCTDRSKWCIRAYNKHRLTKFLFLHDSTLQSLYRCMLCALLESAPITCSLCRAYRPHETVSFLPIG